MSDGDWPREGHLMARGFSYAPGASDEVAAASALDLTREAVSQYAQSKNYLVREAISYRADCPLGMLVALAHDSHVEVRCGVATNTASTRTLLELLSRDRHEQVVLAVIANPHTPGEVVEALALNKKPAVARAAAARVDVERGLAAPVAAPRPVPIATEVYGARLFHDSGPTPRSQPVARTA